MMKLFYTSGACSLASHIALEEAGLSFEIEKVNLKEKVTESGADFRQINPQGYVPALVLDSGEILTEGPAIMQYIADLAPEKGLLPVSGVARYQTISWVNFIATELHKNCGPLFSPSLTEEQRQPLVARLSGRVDHAEQQLAETPYLLGSEPTIADFYLFVVTGWFGMLQVSLDAWPNLVAFRERMAKRPSVLAAMDREGLL